MLDIRLCGHYFVAYPQRALYWVEQSMLLIADLHLGKSDTFREFGISVPQSVQDSDLARLLQLLQNLQPRRCVVLGDLVHGRSLGLATAQAWNDLVRRHPATQFELILGNHDRSLQPDVLELHYVHRHVQVNGVYLSHEPVVENQLPPQCTLNIHGHIHSAVRIASSSKKLPALAYAPPHLSMPAFSEFTAGVSASAQCEKIWVFSPDADLVSQIR